MRENPDSDLSWIGQHYLVSEAVSQEMSSLNKRHYTVCHAMNPKLYQEYMRLVDTFITDKRNGGSPLKRPQIFDHALPNDDEICLTIKNYD